MAEPGDQPDPEVVAAEEVALVERPLSLVDEDHRWMGEALAMAEKALAIGELPIGAVVVVDGRVVGRAFTQEATQGRLLVHAELLALDQADRMISVRKGPAVLYTTLEPCLMCLGAASVAVIKRVVFALDSEGDGAGELSRLWDEHRSGGDIPHLRLPPVEGGVRAEESRELFARFVGSRPSPADPPRATARPGRTLPP